VVHTKDDPHVDEGLIVKWSANVAICVYVVYPSRPHLVGHSLAQFNKYT